MRRRWCYSSKHHANRCPMPMAELFRKVALATPLLTKPDLTAMA